jgi:O-antigen ligase
VKAASPQSVDGNSDAALSRGEGNLALGALALAVLGAALGVVDDRAFELDRFFVPKELALHIGALVLAVITVRRSTPGKWTSVDIALGAWLALSVISLFGATSAWHAFRAVALTASAAVIYWSAASLRLSSRERGVVIALCLATSLAGLSALAQAYGFKLDLFAANRAPGGTLGNRNFIAHIAAMSVPLILWLVATTRSAPRAMLGGAALLVASAALVLSRTRAAWLALAIWLALILPMTWQGRAVFTAAMPAGRKRLLTVSLVGGVVAALILPNTLDWRSDSPYLDSVRGVVNYREGSGAGRLLQYQNSLKMVKANPVLGVGPGNWAAKYPAFAPRNDPSLAEGNGMTANPWPSSDWIAAVSERGIPAALAIAALVLLLLRNAWRGWSDSVFSSRERVGALAGGSVVLVGAIQGTFDAVNLLAFPAIVLWAAAGALIPAGKTIFTRAPSPQARRMQALFVAGVWSLFVFASAAKLRAMNLYTKGGYEDVRSAAAWDPGSYRIQMRAGEVQANRGFCRTGYHNIVQAVSLFPHAPAAQQLLARCGSPEQK